ncbi:MAG TPA: dihydropteroate synthase [Pseudogracilibacillus sp.]|nr:dihydropteroate synthase [Pseudogracilibacillus sp.]
MLIKTNKKTYDLAKRTHVMGILNVTPDSFSDGGTYSTMEAALERAMKMEADGADIIDIGGESTRPSYQKVTEQEESERVIPIIEELSKHLSIPISIDTYKSKTALLAVKAGAEIINDVWGAKKEPKIAKVAAEYQTPIILMHNRNNKDYKNIITDIKADLMESIEIATTADVNKANIILDPGVGFAKTMADNYEVLKHLDEFVKMDYPILLGTSRKSFINEVLPSQPNERDNATGATTCLGITKGVRLHRVHDVKRTVELAKMMDAMLEGGASIG